MRPPSAKPIAVALAEIAYARGFARVERPADLLAYFRTLLWLSGCLVLTIGVLLRG